MSRILMVIVAKAPVAGKVKTRLCPPLNYAQAARLYTGFLLDTVEIVRASQRVTTIAASQNISLMLVCPTAEDAEGLGQIVPGVEFIVQSQPGLTAALSESFEYGVAQGFSKMFCLSSDNPTLPPHYLNQAVATLDACQVVLGPSEDGGYYLIGAQQCYPPLFQDMIWSTDTVLAETCERARQANLSLKLLPEWYDLDTGADLQRLIKSLRQEPPTTARHTRQALEEIYVES